MWNAHLWSDNKINFATTIRTRHHNYSSPKSYKKNLVASLDSKNTAIFISWVLKICSFFLLLSSVWIFKCWRSESRVMSMFHVIKFHKHFQLSRNWKAWSCQPDKYTHTQSKQENEHGLLDNEHLLHQSYFNLCRVCCLSFFYFSSHFDLHSTIYNPIIVIGPRKNVRTFSLFWPASILCVCVYVCVSAILIVWCAK